MSSTPCGCLGVSQMAKGSTGAGSGGRAGVGDGGDAGICKICDLAVPECLLVHTSRRYVSCFFCKCALHYSCSIPIETEDPKSHSLHDCGRCHDFDFARGDPVPDVVNVRVASDGAWLNEFCLLAGGATAIVRCPCVGARDVYGTSRGEAQGAAAGLGSGGGSDSASNSSGPGSGDARLRSGLFFHEYINRANLVDVLAGTPAIGEMAGLFQSLKLCDYLVRSDPCRSWHFELLCDNGPLVDQINTGVYAHCHHLVGLVQQYWISVAEIEARPVQMAYFDPILWRALGSDYRHSITVSQCGRDNWHIGRAHKQAHIANYRNRGARVGRFAHNHWQSLLAATRIVHVATPEENELYRDH